MSCTGCPKQNTACQSQMLKPSGLVTLCMARLEATTGSLTASRSPQTGRGMVEPDAAKHGSSIDQLVLDCSC